MDEWNEVDETVRMLRGNINRMCLTDDMKELECMYKWANDRLKMLYLLNKERLEKDER